MKKRWKIKDRIVFANTVSTAIATFLIVFSMLLFIIHYTLEIEVKEVDHILKSVVKQMEESSFSSLKNDYDRYDYVDKEYMSVASEENGEILYLTDKFDKKEMDNFIINKIMLRKNKIIYNRIYEDRNGRKYFVIRNFDFEEFDEIFYIMMGILIMIVIAEYIISRIVTRSILNPVSKIIKQSKELDKRNINVRLTKTRDDEIGNLVDVLNHSFQKKEELIKSQKKFSSNISHELKTPLAIMKGYLDILKWGKNDEKLLDEAIQNLDIEISNIEKIINSIFLTSNLEKIQIKKEYIDIRSFLEKIKKDYELLNNKLKIDIKADENAEIIGDSYLLSEAVRGIIDNGIKYSDGLIIELILKTGNDRNQIIIRNYGALIDEQDLEKIFDRYYRKNNEKSGVGLGLSIIKEIMHLNEGEIRAENREDGVDMILSFYNRKYIDSVKDS